MYTLNFLHPSKYLNRFLNTSFPFKFSDRTLHEMIKMTHFMANKIRLENRK